MYCDRYVPFKTKELPTRWERFCLFFATPIVKRMGATDWRVFKVAANKLWVADAIRSENSVWPTNKEQQ